MGRATNVLILASIAASLYSWFYGIDLTFSVESLYAKNYITLITAIFAHASFTHLAGNMLFLYIFGSTVERDIGGWRLMLAFFVGGIASFLLSIPFYHDAKMLGASAAIFTLAALAMLTEPLSFSIVFLMPVGVAALVYFIFNIIAIAQGVVSNTAYVAHAIGFLIGVVIGTFWVQEWKKNLAITIVALVLYVALVNLIAMYFFG